MLIFALAGPFFVLLSSPFVFPLFCVGLFIYFFSFLSLSSLQFLTAFFFCDDLACFIVVMTIFVIFISYVTINGISKISVLTLISLLIFCVFVFVSDSGLSLFIFYEASLFPILFIILNWGAYPERSLSALMLLIYTMVFTLPFLFVLFNIYSHFYSFYLPFLYIDSVISSKLIVFVFFIAFSVKLPIYGLHFWLPIAHVEAPTFGSMILAGVLLKLGGAGLIRFLPLFEVGGLRSLFLGYAIVFLVYSTLICCTQSDFKRLIAYSSVSHMIALVPLVLCNSDPSLYSMVLLMLFHGLSSPLLFFLVGLSYESHATRQLSLLRGLTVLSPILSLVFCFGFFFSLSAPPFPSFISEVFFMMNSLSMSLFFTVPLLLLTFLSLVYNLNWLSTILFNSHNPTSNYQFLTCNSFLQVSLLALMSVLLLVLLLISDCF